MNAEKTSVSAAQAARDLGGVLVKSLGLPNTVRRLRLDIVAGEPVVVTAELYFPGNGGVVLGELETRQYKLTELVVATGTSANAGDSATESVASQGV